MGAQYAFLRSARRIRIVALELVQSFLGGTYRSAFRGQGIELDKVREYVEQDDVRRIDWNVTARTGAPHTKVFREERELTLFFIVDVSASVFHGSGPRSKHELECWILAVLALCAEANDDVAGALYFTDRVESWIAPRKGRRHILRLINDLVDLQPSGTGSDLGVALRKAASVLKRRGVCIVISDFRTGGYQDALGVLGRRHDCVAVKVQDGADLTLPRAGVVEILDPEAQTVLVADTLASRFRRAYERYWVDHEERWERDCRLRGVDALCITTAEDPGDRLYEFFEKRRRRR